jgi:hypothetical protein
VEGDAKERDIEGLLYHSTKHQKSGVNEKASGPQGAAHLLAWRREVETCKNLKLSLTQTYNTQYTQYNTCGAGTHSQGRVSYKCYTIF